MVGLKQKKGKEKSENLTAAKNNNNGVGVKTKQKVSSNGEFPIVGIGSSAGGLEALEQFLRKVSPDCGQAFVVVQHLDLSPIMFIAINYKKIVTHANNKVAEILGYPINEIVGKNWFDIFIPKRLSKEIKSVSEVESYWRPINVPPI